MAALQTLLFEGPLPHDLWLPRSASAQANSESEQPDLRETR